MQLVELVSIFASLKSFSDRLSDGYEPPDAWFRDINLPGLAQTTDAIRTAAIAQGKTVLPSVHVIAD